MYINGMLPFWLNIYVKENLAGWLKLLGKMAKYLDLNSPLKPNVLHSALNGSRSDLAWYLHKVLRDANYTTALNEDIHLLMGRGSQKEDAVMILDYEWSR